MYIFKNIEFFIYLVAFLLVVTAAVKINNLKYFEGNKFIYNLRMASKIKNSTRSFTKSLYNEDLESLLYSAGRPFALDSIKFNVFRIILLAGVFLYFNVGWFFGDGEYPLRSYSLLLSLFVLTYPYKYMPTFFLLEKIGQRRLRDKNKECFTLYSMIQNEFYADTDKPLNMYAILIKVKPYFNYIDKAIGKAILLWKRNPNEALDSFAMDIGTQEAMDLAMILKNVDASSPKDARDILESRYEHFVTTRHENHRRYRDNVGLISYIAAFIPVIAVMANALILFNLEKNDLFRFIYQNQ